MNTLLVVVCCYSDNNFLTDLLLAKSVDDIQETLESEM